MVIWEVVQRDYEAGHGLEIANWTASILRIEKGTGIDEELFSMDLRKSHGHSCV